jgi:spermidine/putrescine-binding protein
MNGSRPVCRSAVAMLVVTIMGAGLLSGACGSSSGSTHRTLASRPAGGLVVGPMTVLTLANYRIPTLASLLAPADRALVVDRISFADGDEAVAALKGGRRADILITSSDEYPPDMARAGLLQPLDRQRLPDLDAVVSTMRALPGTVMNGRLYAVPLEAGLVGIVFDPRAVTPPPVSFRAFFARGSVGKVAMIDSPVLGLEVGALALGYREPAALRDAQLLRVTALYETRRDNFRVFWQQRPDLLRAFRSGKVALAAATESDALWLRDHGLPVQFVPGAEGGLLWACLAGIPASAPDPDAAYAFLNSALSPAARAVKSGRYHAATLSDGLLAAMGGTPPEVTLVTTNAAQGAVTVVTPTDYAAWLVAWTKVKQPRQPGCG